MKNNYFLVLLCCCTGIFSLKAQERYLDDVFTSTTVEKDIIYGNNISILGFPNIVPIDLKMEVYTPDGDSLTDRPVFLVAHTGYFLPKYYNGSITGGMSDSTVVNVCKRLTKKGYVAAAFTYRQGWAYGSSNDTVLISTFLQAVFRGIQDANTAVRYLRKSVAEDGNPYGIDPDKIGMWGVGSGAYIALGAATLDEYDEIVLDNYLDTLLGPSNNILLLGNFEGTTEAPLSIPNHVGYSSSFSICVNLSGAIGNISWLDGKESEPVFVGYHSTGDIFSPFADAPNMVPTAAPVFMPFMRLMTILHVSGTKRIIEKANDIGDNDILASIIDEADVYKEKVDGYKDIYRVFSGNDTVYIGEDNMYTFALPLPDGSPWDWWDKATLDQIIFPYWWWGPEMINADVLHANGLITNPTMSQARGNAYLDTIFTHFAPRGCLALELGCLGVSQVVEVNGLEIGLKIFPNPAQNLIKIEVNADQKIENVYLYNVDGRLVQAMTSINSSTYTVKRNKLSSGLYFAKIKVKDGIITKQIMFE